MRQSIRIGYNRYRARCALRTFCRESTARAEGRCTCMRSLSVVVPVYNAALSLGELAERLAAVLPTISDRYELILVEDDSRDRSWDTIRELAARYPWVRGIKLMRNSGQHSALLCGIRAAHHDIIVTLDDDLQHPPEHIATLLAKLDEGYDVVYGTPQREQHGLWRDLASRITKLALQSAMGAETARHVSAFRAFRTRLRRAFRTYRGPFVSIDVLLTWGASRFAAVPVPHQPRAVGASNYTLRKLIAHAMNMATGFSGSDAMASWHGFGFTCSAWRSCFMCWAAMSSKAAACRASRFWRRSSRCSPACSFS